MDVCSKCSVQQPKMEWRTEGGVVYKFCNLCSSILKRDNRSFNLQWSFLQSDCGDVELTDIEKAMIEARVKRASGESCWED